MDSPQTLKINNSIFNCSESGNDGGGIYVTGEWNMRCLVTIEYSKFTECTTVHYGGAMDLYSNVTIKYCLFSRCYAAGYLLISYY
jgi:hypothetical protein